MIETLIENWDTLGVAGILLFLVVWYFYSQVRRQNKREDKRETRQETREDKILNIVDTSLKNIETTTTENKKLNKDIAVIMSQNLTKLEKHDTMSTEAWSKMLTGFDRVLEFLNGRNPAIAKLRAEVKGQIKEIEEKIK